MKKGFIHIYTGDGKGKTTAALGLLLRALGQQKKVCLIQFMKSSQYGEIKFLKKLKSVTTKQFGSHSFIKKGKVSQQDKIKAEKALAFAQKALKKKYDLLVLDEIIMAVFFKLIKEKEVIELIDNKPKRLELILTGRRASAKLVKLADLVTEMKEIKHYFQKGIKARKGIEY